MSKIRTVKPELFRHEQLFEAEQRSGFPLRLIFIGLFTVVDAEGRFRWRPRQLKLDILPYDEVDFSKALAALTAFGFVKRYEHAGESYGYIPTWRRHQSINQREPNSVLPTPSQGLMHSEEAQERPMPADVKLGDDLCSHHPVTPQCAPAVASENTQETSAHAHISLSSQPHEASTESSSDSSLKISAVEPRTCTHLQDLA